MRKDADLARSLAEQARSGGRHAAKLLAEEFRQRRDLDAERRRFIAETTYALLRRGAWLARVGGDPVEALQHPERMEAALEGLAPRDRIALAGSLPEWLADRFIADFGDEAEPLARALSDAPSTDVRANAAHGDRGALIAALGREGIAAEPLERTKFGARILPGARDLYATRAFRDGLFEVQDEGSQLVAELVAPNPGAVVIDACAGEGGKTLAIGALLGGRGRIVACDVSAAKLEVLRTRATRAGLTNVRTVAIDRVGALPPELAKLRADRVLVDAPCTGVGTLRRSPELRYRLDEAAPARLAEEQRTIALRFAPLVERGGRLIYATCTVLREEDEGIAEAIVAQTDLVPMRAAEIWGTARAAKVTDPTGTYLRMFPHRHGTDGFFAAVLRRAR